MSTTMAAALAEATRRLQTAGIDGAARDARRLMAHAAGVEVGRLPLIERDPIEATAAQKFAAMVDARLKNRPVAQIVGRRSFWGRDFVVTSDVLDPRPETETVIATALAGPPAQRILDLGTGSGILALTLLAEWPDATAVAVDLSQAALDVAAQNAQRLDLAARVRFQRGSWFGPVDGQFDLIVGNPPYIALTEKPALARDVTEWEPHLALFAGQDGLDAYRQIAAGLPGHLAPGGRMILEHGPAQGAATHRIFRAWRCETLQDMDGRDRVLVVSV